MIAYENSGHSVINQIPEFGNLVVGGVAPREKIGGTMPEDLPTPEISIQQIEKEQMERLQKKAKACKLMLDE
ncbi:hypothetical protein [Butyrivibrio sp. INlla14]|uniref:hypothetical protein n=1 Tax=Butyrivibrio sp. INlla14 TaxID=1520808 RepID=UPI001FA78D3E|nr:hypothetical protein [Butyrivibrio sp. INlla14]